MNLRADKLQAGYHYQAAGFILRLRAGQQDRILFCNAYIHGCPGQGEVYEPDFHYIAFPDMLRKA